MKKYTIIGNWKMYLSYKQACEWITSNKAMCASIAQNHSLILCPSADALVFVAQQLQGSKIALGAQDCSGYQAGAYTGQIQATSLKELGCTHVIIGHSELNALYHQTNADNAIKLSQALTAQLIPIIAIGQQSKDDDCIKTIEQQLEWFIPALTQAHHLDHFYIAYEPLWAIGTGNSATLDEIKQAFTIITMIMEKHSLSKRAKLLYGGSVNANNCQRLKEIQLLDGFLIGAASIDVEQLREIVYQFSR